MRTGRPSPAAGVLHAYRTQLAEIEAAFRPLGLDGGPNVIAGNRYRIGEDDVRQWAAFIGENLHIAYVATGRLLRRRALDPVLRAAVRDVHERQEIWLLELALLAA